MVSFRATPARSNSPRYAGLRLSADEYLALEDDGHRYQVVNGVVLMSPRPTPRHQKIARLILNRLSDWVDPRGLGELYPDVDVRFAADLVYQPDIVFYTRDRLPSTPDRLTLPPDLAVEVLSPGTEAMDLHTKRDDYERHGVREYWIVDPDDCTVAKFELSGGKYRQSDVAGGVLTTVVLPGFSLDLDELRRSAT